MTPGERAAFLDRVASAVGEFAMQQFLALDEIEIERKGPADFVSEADRQAETTARRLIREAFPDAAIFGEETGGESGSSYWIIDPIDGTSNYLSGLPVWAVSIAFIQDGKPVAGAIAMPALRTTLSAGIGTGLTVRGQLSARTSNRAVSMGVGRNERWDDAERHALEAEIVAAGFGLVCTGSCAASLAFVALGRLAGFVERHVKLWDCAAGVLLCAEVGAAVELRMHGGPTDVDVLAFADKGSTIEQNLRHQTFA